MRIIVTGGAGFVGSNLAGAFRQQGHEVISFDNLRRRGSELSVSRLKALGVDFVHGDVRNREDLESVGPFDTLIECSAEPSAQAGYDGHPGYLINTNLVGTINCLEQARRYRATVIFLSTSRVYPISPLCALPTEVRDKRFSLLPGASGPGWSSDGIATDFPLEGPRTLYGATKLSAELLLLEYCDAYDLKAIVNRCGVITGPWQMGKVDQGFVVLWAARHCFGGPLSYIGFGGEGHQVRDVLHVSDLFDLLAIQIEAPASHTGRVYNVGGGPGVSVSLAELTDLCRTHSGNNIDISMNPETRRGDIPFYVTDNSKVNAATGWSPQRTVSDILDDIFLWLTSNRTSLEPILGPQD
jgi:CDP-paratose 2-epimerase